MSELPRKASKIAALVAELAGIVAPLYFHFLLVLCGIFYPICITAKNSFPPFTHSKIYVNVF